MNPVQSKKAMLSDDRNLIQKIREMSPKHVPYPYIVGVADSVVDLANKSFFDEDCVTSVAIRIFDAQARCELQMLINATGGEKTVSWNGVIGYVVHNGRSEK